MHIFFFIESCTSGLQMRIIELSSVAIHHASNYKGIGRWKEQWSAALGEGKLHGAVMESMSPSP